MHPLRTATLLVLCSQVALAAAPARVTAHVDDARRAALPGSSSPVARFGRDAGAVDASARLYGVTLVLKRTPEQETELEALIAAQHDPASPQFQKWLTPAGFEARFGVAQADLDAVASWLAGRGLVVESVGRNRVRFSGTAGAIGAAFGTELRHYDLGDETVFAPASELTIPEALAPVVATVTNLSSLRPRRHVRPAPAFTSSTSGNHFLTPGDVATIYDVTPAYSAGSDGSGQTIAVVGQSAIVLADIERFQTLNSVPVHDPAVTLVPNSGTSTIVSGDESESDLDLEYASTVAPGATVQFIYVGNAQNFSVFDSMQYAVDQNTATIISMSYGLCETLLARSDYLFLNGILAQASTQGQAVVVSSGDNGSTDCYAFSSLTPAQQQTPAVDFPASSAYVVSMGGTEFQTGTFETGNTTYWQPKSGADVVASAKSYIPERVWNDDTVGNKNLSSGGGGVSTFTLRPAWQRYVPGIDNGTMRLVPDVSLSSSPNSAGYLYCSSDTDTGTTSSCTNGFRDANGSLTVAGGTSFAAPIFAGMLAVLFQSTGRGDSVSVNTHLYGLASNPAKYALAFHDVTTGNNACLAGATICGTGPQTTSYAASTGYDQATGLGSIDFAKLAADWNTKLFAVGANDTTIAAGASGSSTVTVMPVNGYTGTISWTVTSTPALSPGCLSLPSTAVSGTAPVNATLNISAGAATCGTAARGSGAQRAIPYAFAVVLLGLFMPRRHRLGALIVLLAAASVFVACGSDPAPPAAAKGAYKVTISGNDAAQTTASTTMTLTVN